MDGLITIGCIALGAWALGVFCAFFAYGWFEAQDDPYANIPWKRTLDTCIDWQLRLRTPPAARPSPAVEP
jgi:hypothetical protein